LSGPAKGWDAEHRSALIEIARDFDAVSWKIRPHNMKSLFLSSLFGVSLALLTASGNAFADSSTNQPVSPPTAAPAATNSADEIAVIKTTEGDMVIQFWPDAAPKTVANFKKLAKQGFYDGTCFHRVIKGFMIQGGDPLTKDPSQEDRWGTGGPGYTIPDEFNDHSHVRGVISMAHTGAPNSGGSQFFICHGNPTFLDHQYSAFGKLIKGDDVLEKIATASTHPPDRPDKRMGIISITIVSADSVK
jgi:peptidyl-prolyl cis-trans isomerase B (cyclophilin B)